MAKDDYYVIVYQILTYLYKCLKEGKEIDTRCISYDNPQFNLNRKYWEYIMINMYKQNLIEGIIVDRIDNYGEFVANLCNCRITPNGIEYLNENSLMQKIKNTIKDIADVVSIVK